MEFKQYKRSNIAEMHKYNSNNTYPKEGDMIARNPENHDDVWLVAKDYFEKNFEEYTN